jgi:hypothetical protein
MEQRDRAAMQAALDEVVRADPDCRERLEHMPWEQAALFAVGLCQVRALRLRPWEAPPCDSSDGAPADRYGRRPSEIELRQRMKRAGVSVLHPDPLAELGAAEAKPAA